MSDLHPCNFVETGGQFGCRRRLATYIIEPNPRTGGFSVIETRGDFAGRVVGTARSPEAAEALFRQQDQWRMGTHAAQNQSHAPRLAAVPGRSGAAQLALFAEG